MLTSHAKSDFLKIVFTHPDNTVWSQITPACIHLSIVPALGFASPQKKEASNNRITTTDRVNLICFVFLKKEPNKMNKAYKTKMNQ